MAKIIMQPKLPEAKILIYIHGCQFTFCWQNINRPTKQTPAPKSTLKNTLSQNSNHKPKYLMNLSLDI